MGESEYLVFCKHFLLPFLLGVKTMLPQSAQGTRILSVEVSIVAFNLCHLPVKRAPQPEILNQDSGVAEWYMLTQVSAVIHHGFLLWLKYTFIYIHKSGTPHYSSQS